MITSISQPTAQTAEATKRELLEQVKKRREQAYDAATRLHEILAYLRDACGDPRNDMELVLNDDAAHGRRQMLDYLASLARTVTWDMPWPYQLHELAGIPEEEQEGAGNE